jgi:hypothetical protein
MLSLSFSVGDTVSSTVLFVITSRFQSFLQYHLVSYRGYLVIGDYI